MFTITHYDRSLEMADGSKRQTSNVALVSMRVSNRRCGIVRSSSEWTRVYAGVYTSVGRDTLLEFIPYSVDSSRAKGTMTIDRIGVWILYGELLYLDRLISLVDLCA